jgi:hypothetical protein
MLTGNEAPDKALAVFLELIKSGRYADFGHISLEEIQKEALAVKEIIVQLYSRNP